MEIRGHASFLLAVALDAVAALAPARAARIDVGLSTQTMRVPSGTGQSVWPTSSARRGAVTPRGSCGVQRLEATHRSRTHHTSPMPHSMVVHGGCASHGPYAAGASLQSKSGSDADLGDALTG